ncbi:hypothetical protein BC830DRAFT_1214160 [Chytriomyces sp. MP71]|nr:hypothetical protein BC830DRAFT_1214160 [Chytriomyces sp. MP71]
MQNIGNVPYASLSQYTSVGVFHAPHPPSSHGYKIYQSFDWIGFTDSWASHTTSVQSCLALSILGDWEFFSYHTSNTTCFLKRPAPATGIDVVFPTDTQLWCEPNGICWNQIDASDFKNAFDLLDSNGDILPAHAASNAGDCARQCSANQELCAAASYQEPNSSLSSYESRPPVKGDEVNDATPQPTPLGKCFFKQPIFVGDASVYAGVNWYIPFPTETSVSSVSD